MAERLLAFDDLAARGIVASKTTIWRWVKGGKFPRPVRLSAARNAWIEEEIDAYIQDLISKRDASKIV